MALIDLSVRELLAAFRSSDPTPGGGSASALAGAVGASLLAMVAGIPKPRAASDDEVQALRGAGTRCAELAGRMAELVDRDSDAYDAVMSAYRLPKGTEEEKRARTAAVQESMRGAAEVPLDVVRACRAALEQAETVARLGNPNASSDVGVARELLRAGLHGARLNVEINLGSIKDHAYVNALRGELERLAERSA